MLARGSFGFLAFTLAWIAGMPLPAASADTIEGYVYENPIFEPGGVVPLPFVQEFPPRKVYANWGVRLVRSGFPDVVGTTDANGHYAFDNVAFELAPAGFPSPYSLLIVPPPNLAPPPERRLRPEGFVYQVAAYAFPAGAPPVPLGATDRNGLMIIPPASLPPVSADWGPFLMGPIPVPAAPSARVDLPLKSGAPEGVTGVIGDRVWADPSATPNGQQDPTTSDVGGERGLNGVAVSLYRETGGVSVRVDPSAIEGTTWTNPQWTHDLPPAGAFAAPSGAFGTAGFYEFDRLPIPLEGATYVVKVDETNFLPGGPLAGYLRTFPATDSARTTLSLASARIVDASLDFGFAKGPEEPPAPSCSNGDLHEATFDASIWVGDPSGPIRLHARLSDGCGCSQTFGGIDAVSTTFDGSGVLQATGANGVLSVVDGRLEGGMLTVRLRAIAGRRMFPGEFFGGVPRTLSLSTCESRIDGCVTFRCESIQPGERFGRVGYGGSLPDGFVVVSTQSLASYRQTVPAPPCIPQSTSTSGGVHAIELQVGVRTPDRRDGDRDAKDGGRRRDDGDCRGGRTVRGREDGRVRPSRVADPENVVTAEFVCGRRRLGGATLRLAGTTFEGSEGDAGGMLKITKAWLSDGGRWLVEVRLVASDRPDGNPGALPCVGGRLQITVNGSMRAVGVDGCGPIRLGPVGCASDPRYVVLGYQNPMDAAGCAVR